MFLKSLEVQNFRGIVTGRLDLDETTVLIGENDCGKTSLLSALAVALAGEADSGPQVESHHFHRPADPTRAAGNQNAFSCEIHRSDHLHQFG